MDWPVTENSLARSSRPIVERIWRACTWPAEPPIQVPGMPMVLMSGWIAADSLDHDLGSRKRAESQTTPVVGT